MSSLLYPESLPGLMFNYKRRYDWNTGVQAAVSRKVSTVGYQLYPVALFEYDYEFLRDTSVLPEIQTLVGLHNSMRGRYDTFLHLDPDFNSVTADQFATGDGVTQGFQLTALYTPPSGAYAGVGAPEIVQNLNGPPGIYINRWGGLELYSAGSRTNAILQSAAFGTTWAATNLTVTSNTTVAPDGTTTADTLSDAAATGASHFDFQGVAITGGTTNTFSCWLKNGTRQYVCLNIQNGSGNSFQTCFDLVNGIATQSTAAGTASIVSATITPFTGGWYRCSITGALAAGDTSAHCLIGLSNTATPGASLPTYGGSSSTVFAWGAQFETGTNLTAYLPTTTISVSNGGSDFAVGATGIVTFVTAPANAVGLLWSGSFYYRCRFDADRIDWVKFMNGLWSGSKIAFTQAIL